MNNRGMGNGERGKAQMGVEGRRARTALPPYRPTAIAAMMAALAVLIWSGCENAGSDRVLSIEAIGEVVGLVYFDADADREPSVNDTELSGVRVSLVNVGGTVPVASATSDDLGLVELSAVPVGNYQVVVDTATIGDSTIVAHIDSSEITVVPVDTQIVLIAISFPLLTTSEVLALPIGSKTFVDGIALTAGTVFGDSTLHVADASGALRAVRVGAGLVSVGDSVRLSGTVASRDGQPVLDMNRRVPQVLAIAEAPAPDTLSTADAATALSGALDAGIVRIDTARVVDTATIGDDLVATVDDGSGELEVVLDGDLPFNLGPYFVPGVDLSLEGLLVASGGTWKLKPRGDADVEVNPPVLAISDVRSVPLGQVVFLDGKVLTPMSIASQATIFGDSTIHVADTSGAIRITRVKPLNLAVGDSVRFVGTTAVSDGQVVVDRPTAFTLGSSFASQPQTVTTSEAAGANSGALEAAFVRIDSARVLDTATVGDDFVLTVDDGSGALDVVFDDDVTFNPGPYFLPGADLAVDGLLVPSGSSWHLKPRGDADVELTAPVIPISLVRSTQVGKVVFLDGKVLTSMSAALGSVFGDSTVHVADTSGSIRITRVRPLNLAVGDSVRFVGTVAVSDGQTVVDGATAFRLGASFSPLPRTLTTAEAAGASSGTLDAALARIDSARISDTTTVSGELVITVSDGSGALEIKIDDDITFNPGQYLLPGADISVDGVLVPAGTSWQVKPRGNADVTVTAPVITIANARATAPGEIVFVDGTVLTARNQLSGQTTFGDATVHLADPSGAVRGTNIIAAGIGYTPGDSLRLVGEVSSLNGQPIIDAARVFVLDLGGLPQGDALPLATALAATGNGGASDAAFVTISGATISVTDTINGDLNATVDDGSGPVVVVFDGDEFSDWTLFVPAAVFDVWGVLVPDGSGGWVLKPRGGGDVVP